MEKTPSDAHQPPDLHGSTTGWPNRDLDGSSSLHHHPPPNPTQTRRAATPRVETKSGGPLRQAAAEPYGGTPQRVEDYRCTEHANARSSHTVYTRMSARISTGSQQLLWQPGRAALIAAGVRTVETVSGGCTQASPQPAGLLVCLQHVHPGLDKASASISGPNCLIPLLLDSYGTEGLLLHPVHPHVPVTK